jgi:hypothetical protein
VTWIKFLIDRDHCLARQANRCATDALINIQLMQVILLLADRALNI